MTEDSRNRNVASDLRPQSPASLELSMRKIACVSAALLAALLPKPSANAADGAPKPCRILNTNASAQKVATHDICRSSRLILQECPMLDQTPERS